MRVSGGDTGWTCDVDGDDGEGNGSARRVARATRSHRDWRPVILMSAPFHSHSTCKSSTHPQYPPGVVLVIRDTAMTIPPRTRRRIQPGVRHLTVR